ncbi:MMPL family transporter [Paenibacillus chitinolyticus]|uniref:MMPL family transporter n=1 Tax=Paenibacillus chitinolyticus TaxID=79263 RepID=UPI001C4570E3|nr:MMPL family transporter [Paenibacillus chitinolyticus]MBV6714444.1 MMPL family transporter [Paenibacillus chitinolyticus]
MAKLLYRIGRWAAGKPKSVFIGGLAVLLITALMGLRMGAVFTGDMSIPGTKSEQAATVIGEKFHTSGAAENGTVQIIFKAPDGQTLETESMRQIVKQTLDAISKDESIASVASPYNAGTISQTKEIGYANVTYRSQAEDVTEASKEMVLSSVEQARAHGVQTEIGGSVSFESFEIGGGSEIVGLAIAFLILIFMFRSILAAGFTIVTALIGLGIGIMGIIVASNYVDMSSVSLTLAVMLGLAVGIDYGLFIISRHRQNMSEGRSVHESIAIATGTAGSAVVFAGCTVIIALVGLAVTNIPFITMMGLAAALTVFTAVLVAIFIVPAVLGMLGERIRPKSAPDMPLKKPKPTANAESNAWGRFVQKFPLPTALAGILVLAFISLPALHLQTGLPDNSLKSEETTGRRGYDLIAEGFGPGYQAQLVVVMQAKTADHAKADIASAREALGKLDNVVMATEPVMSPDGDTAIITVLPGTGPHDLKTADLVYDIRKLSDETMRQNHVELMVTGSTAVNIDITDKLNQALPVFASLVVGLALILLVMVFRSILVPLKALLGYLLTLAATLGFVVFVVQDGHMAGLFGIPEPGPVLNFLPLLVAAILFGLAMDYEVFLVSRMREKFIHSGDAKKAVLFGLKSSGSVVTAAGLIMISVFASFIFAEDTMIKSMGLALAFGILFDAFIVRMTIVPAVMTLMGRSAWYLPKWLNRILPNIDVEGESIVNKQEADGILQDRMMRS